MNKLFFSCLLLLGLTSCSQNYKINGVSSISSLDGKMLFLKKILNDGTMVSLDSTEVVHGLFSMKGKVDSAQMVTLFMDEEGIMPLILEGGKIKISITNTQLVASGTRLNDKLYGFIEKKDSFDSRMEAIERKEAQMILNGEDPDLIQMQLTKEANNLSHEMDEYIRGFIAENGDNILGPSVFLMLCSTLPYPVMTPQIEEIIKDSPESFRNNIHVKEFLKNARENVKIIQEHQTLSMD